MTIKHAKASAAGPSGDPNKVGGDDWNSGHVVDADGMPMTATTSAPAAPAAGSMTLYAQNVGNQPMPAFLTPDGRARTLQGWLGGNNQIMAWLPQWGMGYPTVLGTGPSTTGNFATRVLSMPNTRFKISTRVGILSTATANQYAMVATPFPFWIRGGGLGLRLTARWGCSDATSAAAATARTFVGLMPYANPANPSSIFNMVGVGSDAGDTTLSVFSNDNSGAATKIPLGANFPEHTLSADCYELNLYIPPSGAYVDLEVIRVFTGDVYRVRLTTDLPSTTTALAFYIIRSNGTTASQVAFDLFSFYCEQE